MIEDRLIRALEQRLGAAERIETHISWVLLTEDRAYKLKKPVELPFLDFSSLEQRKHYCEEELRINRRLAPELYLDVVPIGGTPEAPELGAEPAIEYAVEMRRFSPDATADRKLGLGEISSEAMVELARLIAEFHDGERPADGDIGLDAALENFEELEGYVDPGDQRERLAALRAWTERRCTELRDALERRRHAGAIRDLHGDLHLGNLAVIEGRLVPFDALEFNRSLRLIDVMNEVGFLVMDLAAHERRDLGFVFLNRYLEGTGDYAGLRVLRFFLVYRALVRAKVYAIGRAQHGDPDAGAAMRRYLGAADALSHAPPRPLLAITCGLSGSGKTTLTDGLVARLPALRVRSDVERKRLHGLSASAASESRLGRDLYGEAATDRTYGALEQAADHALEAGFDVIADASFLSRARRARFEALAASRGARFCILEFSARDETLRRRVRERAERGGDASEATEAVLDHQLRHREPLAEGEAAHRLRIDTETALDLDALARRLRAQPPPRGSSTR